MSKDFRFDDEVSFEECRQAEQDGVTPQFSP